MNSPGPTAKQTLSVFGWIAFMWREVKVLTSTVSWSSPWASYVSGFGSTTTSMWLGLERIHQLTSSGNWRLRLEYHYGNGWVSAEYSTFTVGDSSTFYRINIDGCVFNPNFQSFALYRQYFPFHLIAVRSLHWIWRIAFVTRCLGRIIIGLLPVCSRKFIRDSSH